MVRALVRGLLFTVCLIALGGVAGLGGIYLSGGGGVVFLPQVVGKDLVGGLEMLGERGIPLEVSGWAFSDEVPENHIVSQAPPGGRRIRKGRTVSLVISRGARDVQVPLAALAIGQEQRGFVVLGQTVLRAGWAWKAQG